MLTVAPSYASFYMLPIFLGEKQCEKNYFAKNSSDGGGGWVG